jgi:2-oxoglutarate dehydrogenase E1 component
MATAVPMERLKALNDGLLARPEGFAEHRKLTRARERRRTIFDEPDRPTIDWATAEELAFASILADAIPIRVTGQDVARGTFSQRHAVLYDTNSGAGYVPLQHLPQARGAFEIHNSPLTENAVLGFEYGYDVQNRGELVVWEAQYGDFINGAQVMIDEFLTSGRATWSQTSSLVLLLPHGYEGQGPDHSSARPERFLQSAADTNLRLVNCTTAAQYFHLLRRQAALLKTDPLPLIVLTPKSLLRHARVASAPRALAEGRFQPVIDDDVHGIGVRRVLLCSGKVYVDLVNSPHRDQRRDVAIVRVEQLYPFPAEDLKRVLQRYGSLSEVSWVQEEPQNMGAWDYVRPELGCVMADRWPLRYVGRDRTVSTAEGSHAWHVANQQRLVERAYLSPFE